MRLLIAEDEKDFSDALATILEHSHYSVDAVYNGKDALAYGMADNYDAILLDIMMPDMDGLTVLQKLRAAQVKTPILMLTAKGEAEDRIEGLNLGADDYLPKPFVMGELLARVAALTRRSGGYTHTALTFGNITLYRTDFTVRNQDAAVRLGSKEFQILEILMANPRQIISGEQFLERIWGYDTEADLSVVWVNISNLRKKLTEIHARVKIKALRGIGYSLEEDHD